MYELTTKFEDLACESYIALNKLVLKTYKTSYSDRTVYLEDGDEFQIELYNSHTYTIGAKIYINGNYLGNMIVLKPGERIWLERFLDSPKKFKFSTYEVDNDEVTKKAIEKNGNIEIKFFKEKTPLQDYTPRYFHNLQPSWDNAILHCNAVPTCLTTQLTSDCSMEYSATKLETGRVERGSSSNQKFTDVDIDVENWPYKTESFKILPKSAKPVYAKDLQKIYCTECGRKLKAKYKFCPYCGNKIE